MKGVETLGKYLIKGQQSRRIITLQEGIDKGETIFIVKHIQVAEHILVFDIGPAEGHGLVKYGECIPHCSVRLVSYHMQGFIVDGDILIFRHHPEVADDVVHRNPVEIIGLASGQDGRENLVLFRGGKDEYGMCRRLLQCLEEGIES